MTPESNLTLISEIERECAWLRNQKHSREGWYLMLQGKCGCVAEAVLCGSDVTYRDQLIQVAAVAMRAAESLDEP